MRAKGVRSRGEEQGVPFIRRQVGGDDRHAFLTMPSATGLQVGDAAPAGLVGCSTSSGRASLGLTTKED